MLQEHRRRRREKNLRLNYTGHLLALASSHYKLLYRYYFLFISFSYGLSS